MAQCPVCGAIGEDLIFKFYCSNPHCQNFEKSCRQENKITDDITEILRDMWKSYGDGESEEEFLIKFFANGGRFSLAPGIHGKDRIRITEPQWLKIRKSKKNMRMPVLTR
jgi:hypothetical protein